MKRKKVLVVDDEPMVREVIGDILTSEFNVFEANDGLEALGFLDNNLNPQLIITDFNMPRMNGRELIRSLREKRKEIPVICLTGLGSRDLQFDLWSRGIYEYLEKPFAPEVLLEKALTAVEVGAHLIREGKFRKLISKSEAEVQIEIKKTLHSEITQQARAQGLSVSTYIEKVLLNSVRQDKKSA